MNAPVLSLLKIKLLVHYNRLFSASEKWTVLYIQYLNSCFEVLSTKKPLFKCLLIISKCLLSILECCLSYKEFSYSKMTETCQGLTQGVCLKEVFTLYTIEVSTS